MSFVSSVANEVLRYISSREGRAPPCSAVIAAAGSSDRMAGEDKLFLEVCGAPVLAHTLAVFQQCSFIDEIIVVARYDRLSEVGELCRKYGADKVSKVMAGGETRLDSVLNGVLAVSDKSQLIAIHDGARPCVTVDIVNCAIAAAFRYHAVAPAVQIASTVKRVSNGVVAETIDRENLFEIQTPQVFMADMIKAALTNAKNKSVAITDDCMAAELLGVPVYLTEGSRSNIKITTNDDLALVEAVLARAAHIASH